MTKQPLLHARLEALKAFLPLGAEIESFWRNPEHQRAATWIEHHDINNVMLATSLVPDGLLVLPANKDRNKHCLSMMTYCLLVINFHY